MDFDDAIHTGRRRAFYFGIWPRESGHILTLEPLLQAVPPRDQRSGGIQDIRADQIIGTEDRSGDFSDGFYPLHEHMRSRWTKICKLMDKGEISEPLKVFEYGGCYFVRDGHHRVSAGRALGVDFHSAEVTHLGLGIKLPPAMGPEKIPLLAAKHRFEQRTGAITFLGEMAFRVRNASTWDALGDNILGGHAQWFRSVHKREPSLQELVLSWNQEIYGSTMEEIRRRALPPLHPGLDDTDIYIKIMEFWAQNFPGEWFETVLKAFLEQARRRGPVSRLKYAAHALYRRSLLPVEEERAHFFRVSRLKIFRPEARIPRGGRRWYRFLEAQLLGSHYRYLHKKLGHTPLMDELSTTWYDTLFFPALCLWEISATDIPFSQFYPGWMQAWERDRQKSGDVLPLDESLRKYRKELTVRIKNRLSRLFRL